MTQWCEALTSAKPTSYSAPIQGLEDVMQVALLSFWLQVQSRASLPSWSCAFPSLCLNYSDSLITPFLSAIFSFIINLQKNFPEVFNKMAVSNVTPSTTVTFTLKDLSLKWTHLSTCILSASPTVNSPRQQRLVCLFHCNTPRDKAKCLLSAPY